MASRSRSERQRHTLDRVHAGMAPVSSIADPALNEIARRLQARLRASAVAIAVEFDGPMTCRARAGAAAPDVGTPVQRDRGITGECVSTGGVIRCEDTRTDSRVDAAVCEQLGIGSILIVPLLFRGSVVGVVEAFFAMRYSFDEAAVQFLQHAAQQIVSRVYGEDEPPSEAAPTTLSSPVQPVEAIETSTAHDGNELASSPVEPMKPPETLAADTVNEPASSPVEPMKPPETLPADTVNEPAPEFHVPEGSPLRVVVVLAVVLALGLAGVLYAYYNEVGPSHVQPAATAQTGPPNDLRRAAENGDASAQFQLAQAYQTGTGVAADPQQANAWLVSAAENGNPDAQLERARALESSDPVQAYTWYVIAGQAGKTESDDAIRRLTPRLSASDIAQVRYNVGQQFLKGRTLRRDPVAAYAWFALSEWGGNANARVPLQQLESQLTPTQLRDAKSRASAWIRRHTAPAGQKQNAPATASR